MKSQQKFLGRKGTLVFLAIISAFPPLTTDLYLPAMPKMVEALATSQAKVNLTMSLFFIFFAGGLIVWGPLSEKFGRKPILLIGSGIYILSSILCAFSQSVDQLILSRILQAFGGSAVTVVAIAIVKDLYDGRQRERVMATVMSMTVIAPMVAPILGAFLLKIASWRVIFMALGGVGAITAAVSLLYQESLEEKYTGSILRSWGRLAVVLRNPRFACLLVIFSIVPMALLAYLVSASFIYINGFGLSEQEFSYFFAFNVIFATMGPMLYIRLSKRYAAQAIISACFALLMCCGVAVFTLGHLSPWFFALMVAPATLAVITMRVPGTNLMLEQQDSDTGSAAALINFFAMILGSIGMFLVSLTPDRLIESLGTIQFVVGLTGGILWYLVRNRPFVQNYIQGRQAIG